MSRILAAICSTIWVALAAYEAAHDAAGLIWEGYAPFHGPVVFLLVPLWLASACALWSEWRFLRLLAPIGGFTAIVHGVVICLGGESIGSAYLLGGAFLSFGLFSSSFWLELTPMRSEAQQ